MKDINDTLKYKDQEYPLVFNLNVIEEIQGEYTTLGNWIDSAYGKETGEPSIKALSYGVMLMVNEGIDIAKDEHTEAENLEPITVKKANRMLTEFMRQTGGLDKVVAVIDNLLSKSLEGGENSKNA